MIALGAYTPGSAGATRLTVFSLTVAAGTPSDAVAFEIWNSPTDEAADLAAEILIQVLERRPGEIEWTQARDLTSRRWIEIRATGVVGSPGISAQVVDWTPVGAARPFALDPIPGASGRSLEIRANVPGSGQSDLVEISLVIVAAQPAVNIASGLSLCGLRGLPTGLGDGLASYVHSGGDLAASAVPDSNVHVSDVVAVVKGSRLSQIPSVVALNGNAADAALVAGQSYLATLSLNAFGIVVTKSNAGTSPLPVEDRPAVPDGALLLGYVERLYSGVIAAGNVSSFPARGAFEVSSPVSGLALAVAPGRAVLDDREVRRDSPTAITLPASATFALFLLPIGSFAVSTDGSSPDPRALLLARGVTGVGSITSLVDARTYIRVRPVRLVFNIAGPLAVNSAATAVYPGDGDGVPSFPVPVRAALANNGAANTSGKTVIEIERWDGAAWVSLFPSSGTVDRRPSIAYNAASLVVSTSPESAILKAGDILRARIAQIPAGGTAPAGAHVALLCEEP